MTLDRTRWIVRLFFWSLEILDEFTDSNRSYSAKQYGTNLCFFFQTTFVWTPLILLLQLMVYGAVLSALTVAPAYLFGVSGYLSVMVGLVVFVAIVAAAVMGALAWSERSLKREFASKAKPEKGPSSVGIAWEFVLAQKRKVCPMISFSQEARS